MVKRVSQTGRCHMIQAQIQRQTPCSFHCTTLPQFWSIGTGHEKMLSGLNFILKARISQHLLQTFYLMCNTLERMQRTYGKRLKWKIRSPIRRLLQYSKRVLIGLEIRHQLRFHRFKQHKQKQTFRPFGYFGRVFTARIWWAHMTAKRLESNWRVYRNQKLQKPSGQEEEKPSCSRINLIGVGWWSYPA